MRLGRLNVIVASLVPLWGAACNDGTSPEALPRVALSFVSASSGAPATANASLVSPAGPLRSVVATGVNGTLTIDEVQILVDEFKLEGIDEACEDAQNPEGCARFEAPPYFLDLTLDEVPVDIATAPVPAGSYLALKLETKDLPASLSTEVLAAFPDWPTNASLRVAGSFDPADESPAASYVVYFHAEVKVELTVHAHVTPPTTPGSR
jgi:hypothetical protein